MWMYNGVWCSVRQMDGIEIHGKTYFVHRICEMQLGNKTKSDHQSKSKCLTIQSYKNLKLSCSNGILKF